MSTPMLSVSGLTMRFGGINALSEVSFDVQEGHTTSVIGPNGAGKTTTLYAALNAIVGPGIKVLTVEDPVEYHLQGVNQIPVNAQVGMTFERGLRAILRHDPDVVMIGEIRDGETAGIVFQRAPIAPRKPEFPAATEKFENPVDKFVAAYFAEHKLEWPQPVDDRTFLRRASLDTIGLLPTWVLSRTLFFGSNSICTGSLPPLTSWLSGWNGTRMSHAGPAMDDSAS